MRDAHIIWCRITPYCQSFTTMTNGGLRVLPTPKISPRGFLKCRQWTPTLWKLLLQVFFFFFLFLLFPFNLTMIHERLPHCLVSIHYLPSIFHHCKGWGREGFAYSQNFNLWFWTWMLNVEHGWWCGYVYWLVIIMWNCMRRTPVFEMVTKVNRKYVCKTSMATS